MQKEGHKLVRRGREGRECSVYDGLYLFFSIGAAVPVNNTCCLYAIGWSDACVLWAGDQRQHLDSDGTK